MRRNYRKYDSRVIDMIVASGNPNLFPELDIPRSTVMYWINKSKKKIKLKELDVNTALEERIKGLEKELEKERAKNLFVSDLLKKSKTLREEFVKNKEVVVETIQEYSKWCSIRSLCKTIGIGSSRYYQYKVEVKGCPKIGFRKCKIASRNQLTFSEQNKLHKLATDPKLSYLSLASLRFHALRNDILSCSYSTWRKYLHLFGIRRDFSKRFLKKKKVGIRARRINEVWHMDVTEIRLRGKKRMYLQVLMDNFSRKIVSWSLSSNRKAALSLRTLKKAFKKNHTSSILSDAGRENTAHSVRELIVETGANRLIAKKDTKYSNSMVESFFRGLKQRFINKIRGIKHSKAFRKVRSSIEQYNNMPLANFEGATPNEIYSGNFEIDILTSRFEKQLIKSSMIRRYINRKCLRGETNCFT